MPQWKRAVDERLDRLVTETLPDVRKAVKWNTPIYGADRATWFLSFHCFARYVKVAFLNGSELDPLPPFASKTARARYLHIGADGALDEAQFTDWVRQASALPGQKL